MLTRVLLLPLLMLGWLVLETLQFKLLLTFVALLMAIGWPWPVRHRQWVRRALVCLAVISLAGVCWLMPPRQGPPEARVQSVLVDPQGRRVPMPWLPYLTNLVPEAELIRVATLSRDIFPFPVRGRLLKELRGLDPWNNPFVREYRTLNHLGEQRPSVLGLQLLQQFGFYREFTHFVVVQSQTHADAVPVLMFLHGYMGNFQFYSSYLSEFPQAAVLIPSTKNLSGVWSTREVDTLLRLGLEELGRRHSVDPTRVHLVGLSNGGSGVNAALRRKANTFRSLTFLSTWIAHDPGPPSAVPLTIIYGELDGIAANNRAMVSWLRSNRYSVRVHSFKEAGHFVMLTHREEVQNALRNSMKASER